jgi:hypothetical protein
LGDISLLGWVWHCVLERFQLNLACIAQHPQALS